MDTKKFVVEIPGEEFFNSYTETLRKLYTEAFIVKNHLLPSSLESFSKSMSLQAGKKGEVKTFTVSDLIAIAEETNNKYEEYATGGYTEAFRKQGEQRYRSKSKILYDTFMKLGCEEAAKALKYVEETDIPEEETVNSEENPFIDAKEAEKEKTLETFKVAETENKEMSRYVSILEASLKELKKKNKECKKSGISDPEKASALMESLTGEIEAAEKFAETVTRIDTRKFLKTIKDIKKEVETLQQNLDRSEQTIEEPETSGAISPSEAEHIKEAFGITDTEVSETSTEKKTEAPASLSNQVYDEVLASRYTLEDIISAMINLKDKVKDAENNAFTLSQALKDYKKSEPEPKNDAEKVAKISALIDSVEDTKALKPVMISLMSKVL